MRLNNIGLAIKHAKAAILFMSGSTQGVLEDIDTAVSRVGNRLNWLRLLLIHLDPKFQA